MTLGYAIHFYGLAIKTGSRPIAWKKNPSFFPIFNFVFLGEIFSPDPTNIDFSSSKQIGHAILYFPIYSQVLE